MKIVNWLKRLFGLVVRGYDEETIVKETKDIEEKYKKLSSDI